MKLGEVVGKAYGEPSFVYRPVCNEYGTECRPEESVRQSASPQDGFAAGISDNRRQLPMAASAVVENAGKYRDALVAEYHKYPALPPVFDFMDNEAPG